MSSQSVASLQLDSIPEPGTSSAVWKHDCGMPLDEFLTKHTPSTQKTMDGWVWVTADKSSQNVIDEKTYKAVEKCEQFLAVVQHESSRIQEDDKIPTRGRKGVLSKKQRREELFESFSTDTAKVAQEAGLTTGKWLFFEEPSAVDSTFATLAHSIVDGPLAKLSKDAGLHVHTVKASTADQAMASTTRGDNKQVICLYFSNSFDAKDATAVLKVLLGEHGLTPSSVKPDVYTLIGLLSDNPMKMRSSKFTVRDLLSTEEVIRLREAGQAKKPGARIGTVMAVPAKRKTNDSDDGFEKFSDDSDNDVVAVPAPSRAKSPAKPTIDGKKTPFKTENKVGSTSAVRAAHENAASTSTSKSNSKEPQSETETEESETDLPPPKNKSAPISSAKRASPVKKPRF